MSTGGFEQAELSPCIVHSLTGSTEISIGSTASSSSATGSAGLTWLPSVPVDALLAAPATSEGEGGPAAAATTAAGAGAGDGAVAVLLCLRMAPRPRFTPRCACGITLHCSFGGSWSLF